MVQRFRVFLGGEASITNPVRKKKGSLLPEFQKTKYCPCSVLIHWSRKPNCSPYSLRTSLLAAMEGCGRTLTMKGKEAMEDSGLGTPATRAGIIELLIARHYVGKKRTVTILLPKDWKYMIL